MFIAAWAGIGVVVKPLLWVGGFVVLMRFIALVVKMKRG